MSISVRCRECGRAQTVLEDLAGRRIRCRNCDEVIQVPDRDGDDDSPARHGVQERPARSRAGSADDRPRRRRDDEDDRPRRRRDEDDDRPRRRRRFDDEDSGSTKVLLLCGIIGGALLLIGGGIGAFFLFRSGDKPSEAAVAKDKGKDNKKPGGDRPQWTREVAEMTVPDEPAAGKLAGADFRVTSAEFTRGVNVLSLADAQGKSVKIFLGTDQISGKTFTFPAGKFDTPHVHSSAGAWGGTVPMRLEFGQIQAGSVQVGVYVCLPDAAKSFVAGKILATLR